MMRIIQAQAMGLCFGVRDAIDAVYRQSAPQGITIMGQLVHNPVVAGQLRQRGYLVQQESSLLIPQSSRVLVTAHGISDKRRAELLSAGRELIDTTCPLVRKAHQAALKLAAEGRHVIVIGQPGHVEVRGLTEDLPSFDVVPSAGAVMRYASARLGVICQTTTTMPEAQSVLSAISALNSHADVRFINTICQPTQDRQDAIESLAAECNCVVVIGGHNSNNTRKLVAACIKLGTPAYHIESAADICPEWFSPADTIGLTAGTSTLPETIDAVYEELKKIAECHAAANMAYAAK